MRYSGIYILLPWLMALLLVGGAHADTAHRDSNAVRGIVRAMNKAVIASELIAQIEQIPYREGETFKRGDIIIKFDCRRYSAELKSAAAEARAAELTLNSNIRLQKHNAIGTTEVEISRAKHDQAHGRMEALAARSSQCEIKAPYDGRVVKAHIHAHEMPRANEPLIEIVGIKRLEIDLLVPSNWLVWLKPGEKLSFLVDETQKTYLAKIDRIGAVVDPISQTARLSAVFLAGWDNVLPGMSGTAQFTSMGKMSLAGSGPKQ